MENMTQIHSKKYLLTRFVSVVNFAIYAVFVVIGFPGIMTQPTTRYTLAETVFICSAVCFNVYVVLSSRESLRNMSHEVDSLVEEIEKVVPITYYGECISSLMFRISKIVWYFWHLYVHAFTIMIGGKSTHPSMKMVKRQSKVQTPEVSRVNTSEGIQKANSEPLKRTTVTSSKPRTERQLNVRSKYLPLRSPELYKNKIYLNRKSLINSQESLNKL